MSASISLLKLKENLEKAKETADFPHPQNLLKDSSEGLKYLFQKVFLDLLIEKDMNTNSLDYDAFELDDIYELYEFCRENCTHINSKELGSLWKIYSDCRNSKPKLRVISFV